MAELADFIKYIRGSASDCPETLIKDAVREAAIEFCERTKVVTETVTITTEIGKADYQAVTVEGEAAEVSAIKNADGGDLEPVSYNEYLALDSDDADPTRFCFDGIDVLLHPTPVVVQTLTATVVIKPEDGNTEVPDVLLSKYRLAIAAGAKAFIHSQYDDYLDPGKFELNQAVFENGIAKANMFRAKGGTGKRLRTTSRFM